MNTINLKSVSSSEFGIDNARSCDGFDLRNLDRISQSRIPAVNPLHVFSSEAYDQFSLWWNNGNLDPLFISGPSGSGKTSLVNQFCARLNVPVVSVTARPRMDRRELIGHWSVVNGSTVWVDGPASLAWKNGWLLLVNEFSVAPADLWVSCNDILEGLPLDVEATGELLPRHPLTRVVVTDNTRGHSADIDDGFFGRQVQDRSVIDRFWHMVLNPLGQEDEARLLLSGLRQDLRNVCHPDDMKRICKLLAMLGSDSRAVKRQGIGFTNNAVPVSIRMLTRLRDMIFVSIRDGSITEPKRLTTLMRLAFTGALDDTCRSAAEALAMTTFGDVLEKIGAEATKAAAKATAKTPRRTEAAVADLLVGD